jgi:biotin transport system substrate-specific component
MQLRNFYKDMTMKSSDQLRKTVYASLFAAFISAGAYLVIPIGPVPITLQTLFVLLTGLLLGSRWGAASVAIYLLAGIAGLPVFSAGTGGIGQIIGPKGGYLIGFLVAAYLTGLIRENTEKWKSYSIVFDVTAMLCGTAAIYLFGLIWLKIITGMEWGKTLSVGMYFFLPGDALKIAAAVFIARALRPIIEVRKEK